MNEPLKFVTLSVAAVGFTTAANRSAAKLGLPAFAVTVAGVIVLGLAARV